MNKIITILLLLLTLFPITAWAQIDAKTDSTQEEKNTTLEETLSRAAIEREEEKYHKLVLSAAELNKFAQEIFKSTQGQRQLSDESQKKLGKIEKLAKHLRSEQGGGEES